MGRRGGRQHAQGKHASRWRELALRYVNRLTSQSIGIFQFVPLHEKNIMSNLRIGKFVWCLAFAGSLVPSVSQAQVGD